MVPRPIAAFAAGVVLVLAGCSPSAPSPASVPVCRGTPDADIVEVKVVDFGFEPITVRASVGQVVAFSNAGLASHTATLDDGACTTTEIATGMSEGLIFARAGSYPFHCRIHTWMTGTAEIS
jgi:plastocyanin